LKLANTPIERHYIKDIPVYVKREDLCATNYLDAPPFSKIRGLYERMSKLKKKGFNQIAYVETSISMAGWGMAWAAKKLKMKAIIFDPQYVITHKRLKMEKHLEVLLQHRKQWKKLGAKIIPIKPGRAKVNYYAARKLLSNEKYRHCTTLLPLGLPLSETREATAEIAAEMSQKSYYSSIVINVGSGTICAGVIKGFETSPTIIYGIMGRTGNVKNKKRTILMAAQTYEKGKNCLFGNENFRLIDLKYEYTQKSNAEAPFPCHPYYDLKAWQWLEENIDNLESPILFWNIGSDIKET